MPTSSPYLAPCDDCSGRRLAAAAARTPPVHIPEPQPGARLSSDVPLVHLPEPRPTCAILRRRPDSVLSRRDRAQLRLCRMRGLR